MDITPLSSPSLSSALGSGDISDTSILQDVLYQKQMEFVDRKIELDEMYASRDEVIDSKTNNWIDVLGNVGAAVNAAEAAVEQSDEIADYVLSMRSAIAFAAETEESEAFVDDFNEYVRSINSASDLYGYTSNLIGKVDRVTREPNEVGYIDDFGATETKLIGTDLSADFRIEDEDGTVWVPDLGSSTLEHWSGVINGTFGEDLEESTSTLTGLTLVSYDEDTGAIEVSARINGEDQTITGTLKRYGTELMGAWFYNNFETEEDISRAYEDINNAENIITAGKAKSKMNLAITKSSESKVRQQTEKLKEDKAENYEEQNEALEKLKYEYELQYNAMAENIEAMQNQQASYLNIFAGSLSSSSNSLIDILG
jgi:hypothetical protein